MRTVVYTKDMEAITIVDLPLSVLEIGYKQRWVKVRITKPIFFGTPVPNDVFSVDYTTCSFYFEKIVRPERGETAYIIIAEDEILAMSMEPSWLPGQQGKVNKMQNQIDNLAKSLAVYLIKNLKNDGDSDGY